MMGAYLRPTADLALQANASAIGEVQMLQDFLDTMNVVGLTKQEKK